MKFLPLAKVAEELKRALLIVGLWMKESVLREKAKEFAIKIILFCEKLGGRNGRSVLINQIVRSATSIGANLHEANYAASRADFANKLQIALKECYETEYWLDIMCASSLMEVSEFKDFMQESGVIRKMLVKAINTTKGTSQNDIAGKKNECI